MLSLPFLLLIFESYLQRATFATHIKTFADADCQVSLDDWDGPNGYPEGRCSSTLRQGHFNGFKVVQPDPGCAGTHYSFESNTSSSFSRLYPQSHSLTRACSNAVRTRYH